HTRMRVPSANAVPFTSSEGADETTVFSSTVLPTSRARLHRTSGHGATVFRYTKQCRTTGVRYTEALCNIPESLPVWKPNCTKPTSINDNNKAEVLLRFRGGDE